MSESKYNSQHEPYFVKEFFEDIPPGRAVAVKELTRAEMGGLRINLPEIILHCENDRCNGSRVFASNEYIVVDPGETDLCFVKYVCRNCQTNKKTYAIGYSIQTFGNGELYKFGEVPGFGPPTPARVISLIGPDKDYYHKGRRAENQGLGIAAFAYYRRVVENQKNRIFDEIIRVAKAIEPSSTTLIDELNVAKGETQFSKAIEAIKHGIPQTLLVEGENPLTLLHSALSEGLHAQTDEECLELATHIRVVLADLAERLASAVKEQASLKAAVNRLKARKAEDKTEK